MTIYNTTRFGNIDVKQDKVITMPEGILGFPELIKWVIMPEDKAEPFKMFQSLDNPAKALIVIDPLLINSDYHFNITKEDLKQWDAVTVDHLEVYCIVCMSSDVRKITVNLQGPIILNPKNQLASQLVLVKTEYTTCTPLISNITI